jgi:hypothetical protein
MPSLFDNEVYATYDFEDSQWKICLTSSPKRLIYFWMKLYLSMSHRNLNHHHMSRFRKMTVTTDFLLGDGRRGSAWSNPGRA